MNIQEMKAKVETMVRDMNIALTANNKDYVYREIKKDIEIIQEMELTFINGQYRHLTFKKSNALACAGKCKLYRRISTAIIYVSSTILLKGNGRQIIDTIAHEILHSVLPFGEKHGILFHAGMRACNRFMGTNVKVVYTGVSKIPEPKYHFKCDGCGVEIVRYRASNFTKHPENYHCVHCGGHFHIG